MSDKNQSGGLGLCSVLTIIFIVLKCVHVIDWSWGWVLSPIWIPFVLLVIVVFILKLLGE